MSGAGTSKTQSKNSPDFCLRLKRKTVVLSDLYRVTAKHVVAVLRNADRIARRLRFSDIERVHAAALFHDWTKDINRRGPENTEHLLFEDIQRNRAWFERMGIFIDEGIEGHTSNKWIAHAPTSAKRAHDEYGIVDVEVLRAIAHHQTGRKYDEYGSMSLLEKIVLLADYIGEGKAEHESLAMEVLLETANIDLAILTVLTGTVEIEFSRTDKKPTPNGNLIRLRQKLYDEFLSKGKLDANNIGEKQRAALKYIKSNAEKIKILSNQYLERVQGRTARIEVAEMDPSQRVVLAGEITTTVESLKGKTTPVKGRLPQGEYGYAFADLWMSLPPADNIEESSESIQREFGKQRAEVPLSPRSRDLTIRDAEPTLDKLINLFFPIIGQAQGGRFVLFDRSRVFPFPWGQSTEENLLYSFGYMDTRVKLILEDLAENQLISSVDVPKLAESAHRILAHLLKSNDYSIINNLNNTLIVYLQERVIELLVGEKVYARFRFLHSKLRRFQAANNFALSELKRVFPVEVSEYERNKLLTLQILAGTVWWFNMNDSSEVLSAGAYGSVASGEVEPAERLAQNDFPLLLHDLAEAKKPKLSFMLDDIGEGVFDLFMLQTLLHAYPELEATVWVNEYPVDNNFYYSEFNRMLSDPYFDKLNQWRGQRLKVRVTQSPLVAPDIRFFSKSGMDELVNATVFVVKGAAFAETFQTELANTYYAFTPYSSTTKLISGYGIEEHEAGKGVIVNVPRGEIGFRYLPDQDRYITMKDKRNRKALIEV